MGNTPEQINSALQATNEAAKKIEALAGTFRQQNALAAIQKAIVELATYEGEVKNQDSTPITDNDRKRLAVLPFVKIAKDGQKTLDGIKYRGDIPLQAIEKFYNKIASGAVEVPEEKKNSHAVINTAATTTPATTTPATTTPATTTPATTTPATTTPATTTPVEEVNDDKIEAALKTIGRYKTAEDAMKNRSISNVVLDAIAQTFDVEGITPNNNRANVLGDLWVLFEAMEKEKNEEQE